MTAVGATEGDTQPSPGRELLAPTRFLRRHFENAGSAAGIVTAAGIGWRPLSGSCGSGERPGKPFQQELHVVASCRHGQLMQEAPRHEHLNIVRRRAPRAEWNL